MTRLIRNLLGTFVILSILGMSAYVHSQVVVLWNDVAFRQAMLQDVPAQTSRTAVLKKDLDTATLSMQEIQKTIPNNAELVEVIASISSAAISSGISAQVPQVQAGAQGDDAPDELFSDVHIHVVASGDPAALALFLYKVEHLPYLLHIASWKIDTVEQAAVSSFTNPVPEGTVLPAPQRGSSLTADIAIVTKKK